MAAAQGCVEGEVAQGSAAGCPRPRAQEAAHKKAAVREHMKRGGLLSATEPVDVLKLYTEMAEVEVEVEVGVEVEVESGDQLGELCCSLPYTREG